MAASASGPGGALLGLSNDLAGAVERAGQSIVAVNGRERQPATGIHWRSGIIVTTDHALERDDDITITRPDGTSAKATLAGRDSSTDLAILKFDAAGLGIADIGDSATLK